MPEPLYEFWLIDIFYLLWGEKLTITYAFEEL